MQKLSAVCKKYLYWGVLGLFVFIPLYPKFPLFNVPGTYVAIRLEDFLIAIVALWWFIAILPDLKDLLKKPLTQLFILFWGIGLLSLISGIFLTDTVVSYIGLFHYLRRIETMVLFFVAVTAFQNIKQVKWWVLTMFVATIVIVLYGFGQQWLSFPVISTTNKEFSKGLILFLTPGARVNSTFAGHYDLAAYLAIFLSIAASLFIYYKKFYHKVILVIVSFFSFILLALTAARVSFVAALVGIAASFFLSGHKKLILFLIAFAVLAFAVSPDLRHRTVATITVNLLGGGGPKYVAPPPQPSADPNKFSIETIGSGSATLSGVPVDVAPGEPLNPTELGVYRSYGIRLDVEWPRAIRALEKNPFLGTGYSSINIATDNDYLRSLGETGLLGTFSLILIFIFILKEIWRYLRKESKEKSLSFYVIVGILAGLITIFVTSSFIDLLESSKIAQLMWLTLGVAFAVIKMEKYSD